MAPVTRLDRLSTVGLIAGEGKDWTLTAAGDAELKQLRHASSYSDQLPYAVWVGPMASVSQVRKDEDLWTKIRELGVRKILAVEMEAAALYALAEAKRYKIVCFAHVTNQMGQIEGDFEKGQAQGNFTALNILTQTALACLGSNPS